MSIYIAVTTLEDQDILGTIGSAVKYADDKDSLHIGVAVAAGDELFNKILDLDIKQATVKQFPRSMVMGVGRGRKLSRFAYSGEDYYLQIDSHTLFQKGWDTFLISLFNEALQETNNIKTILTGTIGCFIIENGAAIVLDDMCKYTVYSTSIFSPYVNWFKWPLSRFPDAEKYEGVRLVPSNKICGQFVFGNQEFATFDGLQENVIYTDEDIIHTINLLEGGFSMVHPNMALPLTHRDTNGYNLPRENSKALWDDPIVPESLLQQNMYEFMKNNVDACMRFDAYAKCDFIHRSAYPLYVPESYKYF